MPRHVDRDDALEAEVPLEIGHHKRRDKPPAGGINMDRRVEPLLAEQVIHGLDVLILPRIRRPQDTANPDGVLIHQRDRLLGVDHIPLGRAVHELLLNLKVPCRLLPANLDRGRHDDVGAVARLALGDAPVLPPLLHGEHGQHDGLGAADAGGADRPDGFARLDGRVEEAADHGHAPVLDIGGLGVFLVVDEVFGEGLDHELFGFFFLCGG